VKNVLGYNKWLLPHTLTKPAIVIARAFNQQLDGNCITSG